MGKVGLAIAAMALRGFYFDGSVLYERPAAD